MDYGYPLSAFQAFAICLSSFDTKLACEWDRGAILSFLFVLSLLVPIWWWIINYINGASGSCLHSIILLWNSGDLQT
jgi:hypothetical protein